jgi:hypothetical protein
MTDTFTIDATNGKATILKDPNAVLDYTRDWAAWLAASAGDTLASVVWTITGQDSSLTVSAQTNTTTAATVKLSGGTAGYTYGVACKITTAGARIDERTFYVKVKER